MSIDTTEKQFEKEIVDTLLNGDYTKGESKNFDKKLCLDTKLVIEFLENSQSDTMEELKENYGDHYKQEILDNLEKALIEKNTVDVLRKELKVGSKSLSLAFFKPVSGMNPDLQKDYDSNILSVMRQVHFSEDTKLKSIDLVLFINGIPIITAELKNYNHGYIDAITQYRRTRNPNETLFKFKRGAIVHFAVDPYEVYMTTKINQDKTWFIPFNRGRPDEEGEIGKGNPEDELGSYRTSYLWRDIWQKDTLLDILNNFVQLQIEEDDDTRNKKETMIFPRYHQHNCVNYLIDETLKTPGNNFLIEHSTGSGKSNTIAWLAYKLYSLHKDNNPVFDSIIVLSDRTGIVGQLAETILQFKQVDDIVHEVKDGTDLADNLETGQKILVTTQQKFPPALDKIKQIKGKNFAVLIDEAHSSQSGERSKKVEKVLETDLVEQLYNYEHKEGRPTQIAYYSFTATPKRETYQLFGKKTVDGENVAHHKYTMRQAIEEGFILDVLEKYITYEQIDYIVKTTPEDKIVHGQKALAVIRKYVQSHEKTIKIKSEFIVEDFLQNCMPTINGEAKAMVATSSRENAVKFKLTIDELLREKELSHIKTMAAFSGTVTIVGNDYTENNMNGTKNDKQFRKKFKQSENKILIVADKHQTGFDEPLLHTMYVDKQLTGIRVIQTLSRLNRSHPNKEEARVIDFKNTSGDIKKSFEGYYNGGILAEELDGTKLLVLQKAIMDLKIILQEDLDKFYELYFENPINEMSKDLGLLFGALEPVGDRFSSKDEGEQEKFKQKIVRFHKWYSFLTRIEKYSDKNLEKLFIIIKFIIVKRVFPNQDIEGVNSGDLSLKTFKLEKTFEGSISLGKNHPFKWQKDLDKIREPPVGVSLEELIIWLNSKHWGIITPPKDDILVIGEWLDILKEIPDLRDTAKSNQFVEFKIIFKKEFESLIVEGNSIINNKDLLTRLFKNKEYHNDLTDKLANLYYKWVNANNIPSITPDNPAENKLQLRIKIASCRGFLHWIDRYLGEDAFEFIESIDKNKIKEIKLLSSVYFDGINKEMQTKFITLAKKMKEHEISCHMRVIMTKNLHRKIHDRFIFAENVKFNVPSIAQLKLGQYSEIYPSQITLPLDEWWNGDETADVINEWDKIQSKRDSLRRRF